MSWNIKKIKTITAIDVSKDLITWIKVNKDGLVLEWNYHKLDKPLYDSEFESFYDYVIFIFHEK